MPHINLIYPFLPRVQFDHIGTQLAKVCDRRDSFTLSLTEFHTFYHGRGRYTLWLKPEPVADVTSLQAALMSVVPDCGDVARHRDGFTPHLSVGQVRGAAAMADLKPRLQAQWQPISFQVEEVSLIWRNDAPDDIFRVARVVPLRRS
jgi:2'-5' RNA ligase